MKHAYLILAHNEFGLLQTLLDCIDDARNDIYVHIDKKVPVLPKLNAKQAGLFVLDQRVSIYWGDASMIEAEYLLFSVSAAHGPYQYYHLLSGVDLPLKSQDYIHAFCDQNRGKEFIGYNIAALQTSLESRMHYWHLFPHDFRAEHTCRWQLHRLFRASFLRVQQSLGIKRNRTIDFRRGSQWVSITHPMVQFLLSHQDWARRVFTHTYCPDESFVQTLAWISPYKENLFHPESDGIGSMRCIGWRTNPQTGNWEIIDWEEADWEVLCNSPAFFARKFNSRNPHFIEKVVSLSRQ